MTSLNLDLSSPDISKKQPKQHWFERTSGRWSLFSSRRGNRSQQSSKKKKDRLQSNSEVLSTSSVEASKSKFPGSTLSIVTDAENNRKESSISIKGSIEQVSSSNSMLECLLCLSTQHADNFPSLTMCQHQTCYNCLRQYLKMEISESRVNLTCPACQEKLHPCDIISILQDDPGLIAKWEEFLLRRTLSTDPDCRWCPAPDCGFAVIAYGCASCPRISCQRPGCNTEFCYHCRQEWHHNQTCDSAHLQRTKQIRIRTNSGAYSQGSGGNDEIKPCPKCGAFIVKMNDGSCNHMTCAVCEAEFCWLCLQEITDLHYLSPSGCTFWGKKPWSRKKKILWQLGLLIGAPLGIALVAGVAVPAIIIGLPVWVGKKVLGHFKKHNATKHRKNLAAVAAVSFSVVVSPVLAALAVAIGVPVMLLYVYGVVPISLCRTGGTGGVKGQPPTSNVTAILPTSFRLDNGVSGSSSKNQDDVTTFHARSSHAVPANPSIGEGSVGGMTMGSLNMSHGSNLDKIGRGDQDGASTVAMAGTSITGSMSGISGSGYNALNRVEMHFKDSDQHSIQTHTSVGSNTTGVTSVQIHIDNVSLTSTSGLPSTSARNNMIRSYSSKRSGGKTKSKPTKSSSFHSTSSVKSQEIVSSPEQCSSSIKEEDASVLTILDETGDAICSEEGDRESDSESISKDDMADCTIEVQDLDVLHPEDDPMVSAL